ncbi:hypothetical protein SDRG_12634 [Saprolegnia diclina VS20]|uniref:Transmembrane protein n=1 Tax=Saprolegnia diclina (strain VS20) TaxID=1156394 RepID=T0Q832_SAPDV|nr:hypothetical protein SDRG_12634 [Saprolegnia diclina VS20]EQC29630.1 hypothetical protein SDRG_12634 [Saprolegnia diclina VS20]|eukprot:XP_008616934.1 hypothetical protein SDRG_12634 [Saprolegnia diclina VS20]
MASRSSLTPGGSAYLVGSTTATTIKSKHGAVFIASRAYTLAVSAISLLVVALVAGDAVVNNWTMLNYLGGGFFFITPIAATNGIDQLSAQYSFPRNLGMQNLSKVGRWMANYSVTNMVAKSDRIYLINTGDIPLTADSALCPIFAKTYVVDMGATNFRVSLALASDAVTHFRGNALTHFFTHDATENLGNTSLTSKQLINLNYIPGRITVDKRFTTEFTLLNSSVPQTRIVSYYRIFSRSFCTGCDPVAELGYSQCNMTMVYNDSAKTVQVTRSEFVPGSFYKLGFIMPSTGLGQVALAAKLIAIVFAILSYIASRRTVQWLDIDPTRGDSLLSRLQRAIVPKCFPYQSRALSYSMFCYNSDVFVFLYAFSVLIDIQNCLLYVRNVNLYTMYAPQFGYALQLFALSSRLLWVNCAILKMCKLLWNLLGTAAFAGDSVVMGFFNLSSVTSLYVSAIFLFYVPPFIEYNNAIIVSVTNAAERIDGICCEVFNGFYMRVASSIIAGLFANLFLVTLLDHIVHFKKWRALAKHSLARQAIYNSSSIVCDYIGDIRDERDGPIFVCHARRLSTLYWFFTSHLSLFGLPEKKGLRARKASALAVQAKAVTSGSTTPSVPTAVVLDESNDFMIVQDSDHNLRLLDFQLAEVTSLVFNIKILKNTTVTIK